MRAEELLQTHSECCGDTVVLRLEGELDMFAAPLVDRAVIEALVVRPRYAPGSDWSRLCDGAGLRALWRLTHTVDAHRAVLLLAGMHPNVHRTLTRLQAVCPWHPPPSSRPARR